MRARALLLAAAVAAVAFAYATRAPEPGASARPSERAPSAPRVPDMGSSPEGELPSRNVFEFGAPAELDSQPPARVRPPRATLPAPVPEPSPAVRLVGLLRRGSGLKAALSIQDELMVLGQGESANGYTVMEIDEEEGVTVRGPDGAILRLLRPD